MRTWAHIENGAVTNIMVADDDWVAEQANPDVYVETTEMDPAPQIGWAYDGTNFTNPAPAVDPAVTANDPSALPPEVLNSMPEEVLAEWRAEGLIK